MRYNEGIAARVAVPLFREKGNPMTWEPPAPATFTEHVSAKGRARIEHICSLPLESPHLDVGCSIGYVLGIMALANPGVDMMGVDIDPEKIANSKQQMNEWDLADRVRLRDVIHPNKNIYNPPDGWFGSATAFEVLEHVEDPLDMLTDINTVLKRGSTLYATVPKFGVSKSPDHVQDFHDGDIAILMRQSGFNVLDSYDIAGHWRMTIGVKP